MASTPHLSDLAPEILTSIFGHFCFHCCGEYDQPCVDTLQQPFAKVRDIYTQGVYLLPWQSIGRKSLFSLCLVSRRLRKLAQPILHHEFTLGYCICHFGAEMLNDLPSNPLLSFFRTVTTYPDLAREVKHVYFNPDVLERVDSHVFRCWFLQDENTRSIPFRQAWERCMSNTTQEERALWPKNLPWFLETLHGQPDKDLERKARQDSASHGRLPETRWTWVELVLLLLAQLPNLEGFMLKAHWSNRSPPPVFQVNGPFLKTITVDHIHGYPIMDLPLNLHTINLNRCHVDTMEPTHLIPALKTLRITDCAIKQDAFQILLDACTGGLSNFAYEAAVMDPDPYALRLSDESHLYQHSPVQVMLYLERHIPTLESLHLDFRQANYGTSHPVFHLITFQSLKHVSISSDIIYGSKKEEVYDSISLVHRFPQSIISLSIELLSGPIDHHMQLESELVGLADLKRRQTSRFPNLQLVSTSSEQHFGVELESLFRAVGVDFRHYNELACYIGFRNTPLSPFETLLSPTPGLPDRF
ncbi:hypothetical protein AK830_g2925 [Neonectria ditissima]|uniref:Uncharacterized protein n=1 Tax=Neonectria ditissima TaxID=78410 RepID=A0A0P7BR22_9HYPO|nr:hypothetical protein AK830_g2925 [Neonectria ditissima]